MKRCILGILLNLLLAGNILAAPPVALDDRLTLEMVASHPDIVTPTGLTVDELGRVWVIENHTHQRQGNYTGPAHDRIRIFSDPDANGKFRKITTFADGFKNAMSLALAEISQYTWRRDPIFGCSRIPKAKVRRMSARSSLNSNHPGTIRTTDYLGSPSIRWAISIFPSARTWVLRTS